LKSNYLRKEKPALFAVGTLWVHRIPSQVIGGIHDNRADWKKMITIERAGAVANSPELAQLMMETLKRLKRR
jgi:hypothetical protein